MPGRKKRPDALLEGRRVYIRRPRAEDRREVLALTHASIRLHRGLVSPPADDAAFDAYLERSSRPNVEGLLLFRAEDEALVGVFNLSEIVRGNFQSAYLGYYAGEPYAGRGYMTEGLRLVLRHAFECLKLHRIEANIQPSNAASIALARRAGFTREGFSRHYLKISGRWRDHERWALLAGDWKKNG
jgi:ribosomal-protein-alanine N-acetyltransferase